VGPLLGNGLLISEGEFWRRQRRIAAPAFHSRRIADFIATFGSCSEATLARWRTMTQPFDIAAEMMALTLNITSRTMFSRDVSGDVEVVRRLMDIVVTLRLGLLDLLGFPEWLPRRQPKAYRRAIAEFEALVSRFLAERRADGIDRGDLLSMLLTARDPETGEGMSDKQLRDEILTIFLAGHETTANALSWCWYLLAQHPEAEARLHDELDRVLGARMPKSADLAELKWTRMVIEEAMRLYPPGAHDRADGKRRRPDRWRPRAARRDDHDQPLCDPSQSKLVAGARTLRSRAVPPGGRRAAPSLRLSAVRRWATHLHRQQLCARGSAGHRRSPGAALPGTPRPRPLGQANRAPYAAPDGRDLGDARAA
jgi:Cytochrome P450